MRRGLAKTEVAVVVVTAVAVGLAVAAVVAVALVAAIADAAAIERGCSVESACGSQLNTGACMRRGDSKKRHAAWPAVCSRGPRNDWSEIACRLLLQAPPVVSLNGTSMVRGGA